MAQLENSGNVSIIILDLNMGDTVKQASNLGRYSKLVDAIVARRRAEGLVEEYIEEILSGNQMPKPIDFNG